MNKNLFSALKLEKIATFIILSIAIPVASFCIVCTLLLMVTEKGKEIAILKALGASDGAVMRIFMLEGVIIGAIGTIFGVGTALATCTGLYVVRRAARSGRLLHRPPARERERSPTTPWSRSRPCSSAPSPTIYPARAASKLSPGRRASATSNHAMSTPLVVVEDLRKTFVHMGRELHVLRGIDLTINQGEIVAIVGPSGAGKSTFLHCIGTLDLPTSGRIRLGNDELTAPRARGSRRSGTGRSASSSSSTTCCPSSPRSRT